MKAYSPMGSETQSLGDQPPKLESRLYFGRVMHKRLRPFTHRFDYRVFSMLIDLDELPLLDRVPGFAVDRAGLFSFHSKDHGARDGSALRPWIDARLAEHGLDLAGGAVRVLCFPRVLGYVFNPLSIWFCHHRDGRLVAVLYEVRNTFGDLHCYLIPVAPDQQDGTQPIRQGCAKGFYVSPFIGMAADYRFRLRLPDDRLSVLIRQSVPEGELLIASQTGRRRAFTGPHLLTAFFRYPLMTAKVMGAIHWQALRLWLKGARFNRRPAPPAEPVTFVPADAKGGMEQARERAA
ncbi:MAG: DUF1365 domain-containing protein [Rhodovibrionaceae bacterium]|nr:DUF1365 domain-containing protein [Rhodovibrionaceae bacterium]